MGKRLKPRTPYISVYMDPEMQVLIKQEAAKRGIGLSELIRQAVSLYLARTQEWQSLLREPESSYEFSQLAETPPESWQEFYERSTWLLLGVAGLIQAWRRVLIKKNEAQTKGLYLTEEVPKHG
ncbi:ribbon-helix-helix domain-containing protein [Thermus caldilimi]|uniref:ribbon-helix-helix domain-containing protein n=1 Tax=Thermus caldilimi TaxID=2483360 RepID=UPI0010768D92|nr:ribbon-helix-helix domain-containing protein [Thermus caldilimi]